MGNTDYITAFNMWNKTLTKILEMLEQVMLELIRKNSSVHGELTVAKSILGGEDMSIVIFPTNEGSGAYRNKMIHACDLLRKRMMDENNGVGQVCFMNTILDDGRMAVIFRAEDNDRARLLIRDIQDVTMQGVDINDFEIPQTWTDNFKRKVGDKLEQNNTERTER